MQEMMAKKKDGDAEPFIEFDKDDEDTLDFVASSANIRAIIFGIETKSRFDIKEMAGNIIPAIATTNAIVAGLCVLQSFKVLKGDYASTKFNFLSPFGNDRLLMNDANATPNPECATCSPAQTRLLVDLSRATLHDLVEDFLRLELGYGQEFAVHSEAGLLYDVDEDENLSKKLEELGIKSDSFLIIKDEDEENPRVNLQISVQNAKSHDDDKPIKLPHKTTDGTPIDIPRRPRSIANASGETNGTVEEQKKDAKGNGLIGLEELKPKPKSPPKRRASDLEDNEPAAKRAKMSVDSGHGEAAIVIDAEDDGTILIEDD